MAVLKEKDEDDDEDETVDVLAENDSGVCFRPAIATAAVAVAIARRMRVMLERE